MQPLRALFTEDIIYLENNNYIANHFIINDGDLEKLHAQIDAELQEIEFYT